MFNKIEWAISKMQKSNKNMDRDLKGDEVEILVIENIILKLKTKRACLKAD